MMGGQGGMGPVNPPMLRPGQGLNPMPGQPMNPEQAQAQAREMMEKLQRQLMETREQRLVRPGQPERPEANPRPGQPLEVRPSTGEKKRWSASEIIKLREQLHYGIDIEVQDAIYKKLANLDGAKLTAEQAIEMLAPLKGKGTIGEVEWQWLTDTLQGKQVGPCPTPGAINVPTIPTIPTKPTPGVTSGSGSGTSTPGGLVTSTVSASSPHYSATWTSRTGQPITVTLVSGKDKVVFKDVPVGELGKMLPTLDPEARELLTRINLGGK